MSFLAFSECVFLQCDGRTGQNAKGEAVLDAINGIPVTLPPSLP